MLKDVINMLMVDLPGMTKNPVGDQPQDIEHILHKLTTSYIKKPEVFILAVSKATDDIANS
jgi:replication fork clamp-binding protein CrfC